MSVRLPSWLATAAGAYGNVFFCTSPWVGLWFAAMTWWSPAAATAGLTGLAAAAAWGRLLGIAPTGAAHLLNGLLTGLLLGAFLAFGPALLLAVVAAALLATLFAAWGAGLLWRAGSLPALSLAFVLASWLALAAGRGAGLAPAIAPLPPEALLAPAIDDFFITLGWLLLVPYPVAGLLLFAGLAVASPYLALLAVAGYGAGLLTFTALGGVGAQGVGFNFMLAAMALGGIFAIPGRASFLVALGGGALAGVFAATLGALVQPLPLLTLPFLLSVWVWLGALGSRSGGAAPFLILDRPAAPEASFERLRLARVRGVATSSLPLLAPFYGQWRVSQGFDGPHTHRAPWQHGLDFHIVEQGRPCRGEGRSAEDYFCFGAPVLAPAAGQVAAVRDDLPDLAPGEVDVANNWGNHLLLRTAGGDFVLLAHLRQGSAKVQVGEWVAAGQPVAACGSSGRSPEPHLHLHVQVAEALGSPTRPCHLVNVLVREAAGGQRFHLQRLPGEGDEIGAAQRDQRLAAALHLPAGTHLDFCLDGGPVRRVKSELTLLGQFRLASDEGASAAFEETASVLAHYDRQGGPAPLLDLWLLALGVTPLSASADSWRDRPALALLPLGPLRRLLLAVLRPLGGGCASNYRRAWDDARQAWRQEGEHSIRLLPGLTWRARTLAWIEPGRGVAALSLELFGRRRQALRLEAEPIATFPPLPNPSPARGEGLCPPLPSWERGRGRGGNHH